MYGLQALYIDLENEIQGLGGETQNLRIEMLRIGAEIEFQNRLGRTKHELWSDRSYSDAENRD